MKAPSVKQVTPDIPVIDISAMYNPLAGKDGRLALGREIVAAAEKLGAFYITGYDLAEPHINQSFDQSRKYFSQSIDFKLKNSIENSERFQGYEPVTDHESKEAYVLGPERAAGDSLIEQGVKYHGVNQWPDKTVLPKWRQTALVQMHKMLETAKLLNRAIALGLGEEEDVFDNLCLDPMYALRFLHYAPKQQTIAPGMVPHTDWGVIGLLLQDDAGGLFVEMPDGQWREMPPIPGTMIINIGEMMARLTNNRIKAVNHYVQPPQDRDRYSIAFFLDMDHDAVLKPFDSCVPAGEVPLYDSVTVEDFVDMMHKRDYSA